MQPHIVHTDPNQSAWVAAVDAAISDQLRAILHQPAFQALEATWRSVQGLVADFDSDTVQVALFDVTRQELLADLRSAGGDPTATSLYTRLIDRGVRMPDGQPWSLLIGDYRFGAGPEDIALLAALGALAAHAGGPFLAEAAPDCWERLRRRRWPIPELDAAAGGTGRALAGFASVRDCALGGTGVAPGAVAAALWPQDRSG